MKTIIRTLLVISIYSALFVSCKKEEDEENELQINFKTTSGYTYNNVTIDGGSSVKIGITAKTEKSKDPIIRFSISEAVNGGKATTVYSENLANTDYEHDYEFTLDTISGDKHNYIFNITNKDGFNAAKSLIITVK